MKATAHFSLILILLDELIVRTSGVKWLYISTQGLSHNHLNIAQGEELNTSYTGGGKGKSPSKSHSTPWGAQNSNLIDDERECDKIKGMVKKQRRICKKNLELMRGVQSGGWEAIAECQYQFRGRRWNCTTLKSASVFGKIINRGTRETAFLHAISSAGVAHSVTRYCSSGTVDQCGCDKTVAGLAPQGNFQWAGCSDNVAYGNAFTKTFVDSRERVRGESATRALMNLHNNNAGRKILEDSVQVLCKCHGVSGSCEMRTCWRALPPFRHIGDVLREKFDSATEVLERRVGSRRELVGRDPRVKPHEDSDLVYVENSPDFCERNLKVGSVGTRGRHCKRDSEGMDGCELMCCGRGFQTLRVQITERCRCSFHWCCTVKCQMCRKEVEIYVCR